MIKIKSHAKAIFKNADASPPWARMIICGLATAAPLMVGLFRAELTFAIYAALLGYFVALNDHLGTLLHRLLVVSISFVMLVSMFLLGLHLHEHFAVFLAIILSLTYWLGLMGGLGAEVERLLLFSIIEILIAFHLPKVPKESLSPILQYGLVAFAVIVTGIFISDRFLKGKTQDFARIKPSLRSSLTFSHLRHLYAFSYVVSAFVAIALVRYFEIERGYWTIVTVMLVMKPDQTEVIYRSFQRLIGTIAGVLVGEALIVVIHRAELLVLGVMLGAFFIPYAMKRNYWMVSFLISIVVMFLLSIPVLGHPDTHLPFLRLQATFYGCLLTIFGGMLFSILALLLKKDPSAPSSRS